MVKKEDKDKSVYCGANKPSGSQRLGTMKECSEKNQIRLWGLKKTDVKSIHAAKGSNKSNAQIRKEYNKWSEQYFGYRGKLNRITKLLKMNAPHGREGRTKEETKDLEQQLENIKIKLRELVVKKPPQPKTSRQISKKSTKKTSRKVNKKSSRKMNKKSTKKSSKKSSKKTSRKTRK